MKELTMGLSCSKLKKTLHLVCLLIPMWNSSSARLFYMPKHCTGFLMSIFLGDLWVPACIVIPVSAPDTPFETKYIISTSKLVSGDYTSKCLYLSLLSELLINNGIWVSASSWLWELNSGGREWGWLMRIFPAQVTTSWTSLPLYSSSQTCEK